MKLGFVTYQIGKDWDVQQIIEKCQATGFEGAELRTTHAHGVEVSLNAEERSAVRKQFEDAGVEIAGLGSSFDYHAVDASAVQESISGTIEYARLAADLGCPGIKVRPNGLQTDNGIPEEKTLEQIGLALGECGKATADLGVQIRVEVHGKETKEPRRMRTIMDHADHDNVAFCWNSNFDEVGEDGTIQNAWDLMGHKIGLVHITELCKPEYPWRELFAKLKGIGYSGFNLAEIPGSEDAERLMRYYRALWLAYQN
jgi:sugar phosphate isomerase/epimerase